MFTLVAIVVLFLVCNTIKLAINSYDMAHYTQVKSNIHFHRILPARPSSQTQDVTLTFNFTYTQILACQAFNPDMNFGYSQQNHTLTRIGKRVPKKRFNFSVCLGPPLHIHTMCVTHTHYTVIGICNFLLCRIIAHLRSVLKS